MDDNQQIETFLSTAAEAGEKDSSGDFTTAGKEVVEKIGRCLLDDSTRLVASAERAGVDITFKIWEDMVHVWQAFASILPEGQESIEEAGAFIRKKLV